MKNLRTLRERDGLTMKDLGKKIGVAESTISLYEAGKRQPDFATLISLADLFSVTTDYLLGRKALPPVTEPDLPAADRTLLSLFHQLSEDGQTKLIDQADTMVSSGKYSRQ